MGVNEPSPNSCFLSPKLDSEKDVTCHLTKDRGFGSTPQIHKDEVMRNRKRVKEINQYVEHVQNELDNLDCGDILD